MKQLPNFLLATPILSLSVWSIIHYVKLWPEAFVYLGLGSSPANNELTESVFCLGSDNKTTSAGIFENETSSTLQGSITVNS